MFETHRFLVVFLLTTVVSIALSISQQGNVFRQLLDPHHGTGYFPSLNSVAPAKSGESSSSLNLATAASSNSARHARQRGGGWGWMGGGSGDKGGTDILHLITGLGLLALLATAFYATSSPTTSQTIIINTTGRKRRSTDDLDSDYALEGESWAVLLSRLEKYFDQDWGSENGAPRVEPFKLY